MILLTGELYLPDDTPVTACGVIALNTDVDYQSESYPIQAYKVVVKDGILLPLVLVPNEDSLPVDSFYWCVLRVGGERVVLEWRLPDQPLVSVSTILPDGEKVIYEEETPFKYLLSAEKLPPELDLYTQKQLILYEEPTAITLYLYETQLPFVENTLVIFLNGVVLDPIAYTIASTKHFLLEQPLEDDDYLLAQYEIEDTL